MGAISDLFKKVKGNLKTLKAKAKGEAPAEQRRRPIIRIIPPPVDPEVFVEQQRRPFINGVYQYVAAMTYLSEGEIVDLAQEFEDKFELCFLKAVTHTPETKAAMAWMTAFIEGDRDLEDQLAAFQPKWRRIAGLSS